MNDVRFCKRAPELCHADGEASPRDGRASHACRCLYATHAVHAFCGFLFRGLDASGWHGDRSSPTAPEPHDQYVALRAPLRAAISSVAVMRQADAGGVSREARVGACVPRWPSCREERQPRPCGACLRRCGS